MKVRYLKFDNILFKLDDPGYKGTKYYIERSSPTDNGKINYSGYFKNKGIFSFNIAPDEIMPMNKLTKLFYA